ncbi:MAG: hypothetical protein ACRECX_11635 [Methyloceanibacter sp.]|uniref:hypothetical protein n=1 Tax=Methyloceanibacter sp. TaxID=1965321 RepID=UPI003D6D0B20
MTLRRWAALLPAIMLGTLFGTTVTPKQALAEFEIQESEVEKGETEVEYRGAVHWGFPGAEREEAEEDEEEGEGGGALDEEEEGEFVRQSHDIELQYGITERWLISTALSADEPLDEDFDVSSVEIELQYELIEREGNGIGLAFIGAYGFATRGGEADEIEFGPIVELGSGPLLLTTNTFFTSQVGDHRETDGLGFEYGWRAEYKVASRWGVGVEMFGEIEDLSNAGSFDDQAHSIGPTLFYNPGGEDDDIGGEGDDDDDEIGGPPELEFVFNIGVQFGLTDVTSDTALKFQGGIEF